MPLLSTSKQRLIMQTQNSPHKCAPTCIHPGSHCRLAEGHVTAEHIIKQRLIMHTQNSPHRCAPTCIHPGSHCLQAEGHATSPCSGC